MEKKCCLEHWIESVALGEKRMLMWCVYCERTCIVYITCPGKFNHFER